MKHTRKLVFAFVALASTLSTTAVLTSARPPREPDEIPLSIARIYWEYNASADDLGVHVFLDGEDWKTLRIENPKEQVIFEVRGKGPYAGLGMTELFFEGAEPSLAQFPLKKLLGLFPEGTYDFEGLTVDGEEIEGEAKFSHAIPDGPEVFAHVSKPDFLEIDWNKVTGPPLGFPNKPIQIVAYQVIVESFQVTVPANVLSVTVPPEFVGSLKAGEHAFEVLAIEKSGNQTLTEGTFVK